MLQGLLIPPKGGPATVASAASRYFTADNLYEEIDGQATAMVEYGVTAMATRTYQVRPDGGTGAPVPVTMRIYDVGTPLKAFGAFSQIQPPGSKPAAVGAAGVSAPGQVLFFQGRYLVHLLLVDAPASTAAPAILLPYAKVAAARLPLPASLPAELRLLPRTGLQRGSERYSLANALGLEYLHDALTANYRVKGQEEPLQLTLAMLKDTKEAAAAIQSLRGELQQSADLQPPVGQASLQGAHPLYGRTLAFHSGRYLIVLLKAQDTDAALSLLREALAAVKGKP